MKLYQHIASLLDTLLRCEAPTANSSQAAHVVEHRKTLKDLVGNLPSGSGFDNGTSIDLERSTPNRVIFRTAFHHMNEAGFYTGWSNHDVIMTPSLVWGFDLHVTGRDMNDVKEYIAGCFHDALNTDLPPIYP